MKAVIFDFDGTLADTLPVCFHSFQAVFKEFDDLDLSPDEIKAMFGPTETGVIKKNLRNGQHDQAIELYYDQYSEKHRELVLENDEIKQLLLLLKREGYKIGIVTGKAKRSLLISLEQLNMENLFDVMIAGDDVEKPKPHPEGINKALTELGVKNSEAVFVGDSDADILAGKRANVHTIGVQWLPNYQTAYFSVQPDQLIDKIDVFVKSFIERDDR